MNSPHFVSSSNRFVDWTKHAFTDQINLTSSYTAVTVTRGLIYKDDCKKIPGNELKWMKLCTYNQDNNFEHLMEQNLF